MMKYARLFTTLCLSASFVLASLLFPQTKARGDEADISLPPQAQDYSGQQAVPQPSPTEFTNPTLISIPYAGIATPYPSAIGVAGLPPTLESVEVTICGFSHSYPNDVGIVLVGPTGAALLIQDGAGSQTGMENVTYTLSDTAAARLPDAGAWQAGTYRPAVYYTGHSFPSPGPELTYHSSGPAGGGSATFFSTFGGTNPNGTWSLYVVDFAGGDGGRIDCGWSLNFYANNPCDDEAAPLDASGNVIFPSELDPNEPITYDDVDENAGNVSDLYSPLNTSTDTWYPGFPCNPSIGGTVPMAASNPDVTGDLASAGITGVTPEQLASTINGYQDMMKTQAEQEVEALPTSGPVTNPFIYTPPVSPHCVTRGCKYIFGGRDLVFVHGLDTRPLLAKMLNTDPRALTTWPDNRAEFYGTGYWKRLAESYWADFIERFLRSKGIMNRYLIVAYPSTQRLEIGVQAILAQISDAMISGTDVVDPSGRNDKDKFGTPSFVAITHSTGGLAFDVAMTAAATYPNLKAQFIPQFGKAHLALHAVFSGSSFATAAVALSAYIAIVAPPWLCPFAKLSIQALNQLGLGTSIPTFNCPINWLAVLTSILVDLVPPVTQVKWGRYVRDTPVRTLTVIGGHPSYNGILKHLLLLGFDDGVSTINSQVANPNFVALWPSGFQPISPFGFIRLFDMGVARTYPLRAIGYYRDQVGDRFLNPFVLNIDPFLVAGAATPYVSPTGMVEPVGAEYPLNSGLSPLRRYPNHFSFIQSTADHFGGSIGLSHDDYPGGYNGNDYAKTFSERNSEETRVITDPNIFASYDMFYPNDNQPLIRLNKLPPVQEIVRGRKVTFRIRIFGHTFSRSWWIWKRRYHLLTGWENKTQMDYLFESALTDIAYQCPPPDAAHDCNNNGMDDHCDIINGTSSDCDGNGVPDECEGKPMLTDLDPVSIEAGSSGFTLIVHGMHFTPVSTVYWNGSPRLTSFISTTELRATITAADVAAQGTASVSVRRLHSRRCSSNSLPFTIDPPPSTHMIDGQITRNGTGINGVTMTLSGSQSGSTVTDSNGHYSFPPLAAGGNYTVTPAGNYIFSPKSLNFTNLRRNQIGNFAASLRRPNSGPHDGFDFDGDTRTDISVFRPASDTWYILQSSNNALKAQGWGISLDRLTPADYDGDGKADIAVFRPSNGTWYILRSSNNIFVTQQLGQNDDLPMPGDYDADGKADIAVFRPSNGTWYILQSSNNALRTSHFGQNGDVPVAADYDDDDAEDIAVFRSTGDWYILNSATNAIRTQHFGQNGDLPVTGDFDGDGKADLAIFRPANGGWYILDSATNASHYLPFGASTDRPVAGDYDGDGKTDVAVFRPGSGTWYIQRSSNGVFRTEQFGTNGDRPIPAEYVR